MLTGSMAAYRTEMRSLFSQKRPRILMLICLWNNMELGMECGMGVLYLIPLGAFVRCVFPTALHYGSY